MALASFYAKRSRTVEIHLARHGETDDNAGRVFQGQSGRGLNARGRAQAEALGRRVRSTPYRAIVTSDLERAHETARIVAACFPTGVPVEIDVGLREVDVGTWTGKGHDEVAELFPEEWSAWEAGLDVRRGGGETYAELAERMDATIARICARFGEGPLLVVSHGGAIKSWVAKILAVGADGLRALAGLENASLTRVARAGARHRLLGWNDVAHLE
jgi:broad specificity phosphatase PhoE